VLGDPSFGVCRPAGVKGSIGTFEDVAITGHFPRFFFANIPPNSLSDIDGISGI
jgi:hypothetical protein